ncbi:S1C family serine protease [Pseudomonas oryzihabitans]|uniref:S1C family serine protease n=1 Tax=Pseudomonas oryzihabitans TaxID=47885 RepID=UPI0028564442|nr:trypsin-like peptidase domain-containing protein [Pseudomonas psychrotolerans]MDR6679749.1 serine protease DegS [Pseudomonas psychrotolerans]
MYKALRYLGWPVVCGLLVAALIIQRYPQWLGLPTQPTFESAQVSSSSRQQGPVSYADAASRAAPAVASLRSTKAAKTGDGPADRKGAAKPAEELSLGSAVLMTHDGYLLTNNHVTLDAESIVVALADGRQTLAKLIGSDPATDLAVLKIDLPNLPAISVGDSSAIRIGDVVLAIGNPFGVGQTVTMGIISATGRNQLGLNTYEDFIQTDAAINLGNSGGALVDANGNLIGINTAILSGGSQGIGFAIPIKLAMEVMKSIIQHGQVIRGWLGVAVEVITPELVKTYGLKVDHGIVVTDIDPDGPAYKAGLRSGDVLVKLAGQPVKDGRLAMNQIARKQPGDSIAIEVQRQNKTIQLKATVGLRPLMEKAR